MKTLLSASEMKQVRGGADISTYCHPGEKLYSCTTTYEGGAQSSGVVCAKDGGDAATRIKTGFDKQVQGAIEIIQTACS